MATPAISSVMSVDGTSVKIAWKAVEGASKYKLYRSTSAAGTYTEVASTSSTSFTNTGLTSGKGYYYKVPAYSTVGGASYYSGYSSYKAGVPLAAPVIGSVESVSGTSVKIKWSTIAGADKYKVYRSTSAAGPYTMAASTCSTSFTDNGLTSGVGYYYKLRAYSTLGDENYYSGCSAYMTTN